MLLASACSVTQLFFYFRADVPPKAILLTPFKNHIDYHFYFLRLVKASIPNLACILCTKLQNEMLQALHKRPAATMRLLSLSDIH